VFGAAKDAILVTRTTDPIVLDGRLDEPAWRTAAAVSLFQQSPRPGGPTPYTTLVRVLISGNRLYFGFECTDPNPSAIAVHTMQRDGNMEGDDTIALVLDAYGDHRTGYYFRI